MEVKIVEWTGVLITRLTGQTVRKGDIANHAVLAHIRRSIVTSRGDNAPEAEAQERGRMMARKDGIEPVTEHQTIESHRRRQDRCPYFSPKAGPSLLGFQ